MSRTVVGVLRGGTSNEYSLSLKTGAAMMNALPQEKYDVRDILVDRQGYWHLYGKPTTPGRALAQLDVVLNAIHGGVGEDGTVQRILRRAGVPFAGSRALPSGMALNKVRARQLLRRAGVRMPRAVSFSVEAGFNTVEMAQIVFSRFGPPYMVKPPGEGAGRGLRIARTVIELPNTVGDVMDEFGAAIIEEYVLGDEASVGVIERFRNEELYVLPPAHVEYEGTHLVPYAHEEARIRHTVPSKKFTFEQKAALAEIARRAHRALDLSHFSRADVIVTPNRLYLLEMNTVPGLYEGASFPHMLASVGSSVTQFLEHAIDLARLSR